MTIVISNDLLDDLVVKHYYGGEIPHKMCTTTPGVKQLYALMELLDQFKVTKEGNS